MEDLSKHDKVIVLSALTYTLLHEDFSDGVSTNEDKKDCLKVAHIFAKELEQEHNLV